MQKYVRNIFITYLIYTNYLKWDQPVFSARLFNYVTPFYKLAGKFKFLNIPVNMTERFGSTGLWAPLYMSTSHRSICRVAYYTSRTSYLQTLVSPGILITWAVSQPVLRYRMWQMLILCPVLCLCDSCESVSNQPAYLTHDNFILVLYECFSFTLTAKFSSTSVFNLQCKACIL
jgi:hypothetical protein